MSEAVIQIYDGAYRTSRFHGWAGTKRGDIIDVRDDGFKWAGSESERAHFRVLQVPWLETKWWDRLLDLDRKNGKLIQKRKLYLNIDSQNGLWLRDKISCAFMIQISIDRKQDLFSLVTERLSPVTLNGLSD